MNNKIKVEPQGPLFWLIEIAVAAIGFTLAQIGGNVGGLTAFIVLGVVSMFCLFLGPVIHQWLVRRALKAVRP